LRTAGLIDEPPARASAMVDVEGAEAAAGKFDEAARIAATVDAPFRLRALNLLAWEQFKAGGANRAAETLASARAIVTATTDGLEQARGFAGVAALEAEVGDAKAADADFAQARAALAGLSGGARANLVRVIAYNLAAAGRSEETLALLPEIDVGPLRNGVLIEASLAQSRAGDDAGALATLEQVTDRPLQTRLLEDLAVAMAR